MWGRTALASSPVPYTIARRLSTTRARGAGTPCDGPTGGLCALFGNTLFFGGWGKVPRQGSPGARGRNRPKNPRRSGPKQAPKPRRSGPKQAPQTPALGAEIGPKTPGARGYPPALHLLKTRAPPSFRSQLALASTSSSRPWTVACRARARPARPSAPPAGCSFRQTRAVRQQPRRSSRWPRHCPDAR